MSNDPYHRYQRYPAPPFPWRAYFIWFGVAALGLAVIGGLLWLVDLLLH